MRGIRSKIIGYQAAAETIGQYKEVTKSLKRKMKREYKQAWQEKIIKPRNSKRQQRLMQELKDTAVK